jgi:hypothetical protein
MKIIVLTLLFSCLTVFAQTNIISFTNADGIFITNANAIKIAENKLLYRIPSGGGIVRLDSLPEDIRKQFNYNPTNAAIADDSDEQKKEMQAELDRQMAAALKQKADFEKLKGDLIKESRTISGKVIQKIPEGLLVDNAWSSYVTETIREPSPATEYTSLCLLIDYPEYDQTVDGDYIHILAYPAGQYVYTTVNNSQKTVRKFTVDFQKAIDYKTLNSN